MAERSRGGRAGRAAASHRHPELTRAKLELVAAREEHAAGALSQVLVRYPAQAADLIEFSAALSATSAHLDAVPTPETEQIATRAAARAFASVFPGMSAPALVSPSPATLKSLRAARQITLVSLAQRLRLGVDVLSALEAGRIAASTVPARLVRALGEALDAASDEVTAALGQPALRPALLRSRSGQRKDGGEMPALNFADAVRLSPEMTAAEKAAWLVDEQR